MTQIRFHILVTTDFSDVSIRALDYAKQQALLHGAESSQITLLHVIEDVHASHLPFVFGDAVLDASGIMSRIRKDAEEQIQKLKEEQLQGVQSDVRIIETKKTTAEAITEFIAEQKVDLLVMTSHGRRGVNRFFLGSVTEKMLRIAPCPVLLIPGGNGE